jgi:hypothetical protein
MGKLGAGITLVVIGAILTFALTIDIPGIGKDTLGIILMVGGLLAIGLWLMTENQYRQGRTVVGSDPVVEDRAPLVDDGVAPVAARRRRRFL